ncbi:MAG: DUF3267 domain-containing protein [Candidatus Metalachnospira sp.]|nr:DUF3267 domain-containing protein [Candidatus Metalachnospira sp.]
MPLIKNSDIKQSASLKISVKIYSDLREEYLNSGYEEFSYIQSDKDSNISAIIFALPIGIAYFIIASLLNRNVFYFGESVFLINLLLVFASTPIHELFHGLGWSYFCRYGFKSIYIYLPVSLSNAYCHCAEPFNFKKYAFGTMLPMILLSILPFIISLIFQNTILFWFSIFSAFGCGCDIKNTLIAYKHRDEIFLDYPSNCGFTSYKKKD